MTVDDLIKQLQPYKGYDLETTIHLEVKEEILDKRNYKYPYDNFKANIEIDDVGHSDNIVLLGVTLKNAEVER